MLLTACFLVWVSSIVESLFVDEGPFCHHLHYYSCERKGSEKNQSTAGICDSRSQTQDLMLECPTLSSTPLLNDLEDHVCYPLFSGLSSSCLLCVCHSEPYGLLHFLPLSLSLFIDPGSFQRKRLPQRTGSILPIGGVLNMPFQGNRGSLEPYKTRVQEGFLPNWLLRTFR